jgi:hypothetical protein
MCEITSRLARANERFEGLTVKLVNEDEGFSELTRCCKCRFKIRIRAAADASATGYINRSAITATHTQSLAEFLCEVMRSSV